MAYLPSQYDDKQKKFAPQTTTSQEMGAAPYMSTTGGSPTAAPTQQQRVAGGGANYQAYVAANRPQAQGMASKLGEQMGSKTSQMQGALGDLEASLKKTPMGADRTTLAGATDALYDPTKMTADQRAAAQGLLGVGGKQAPQIQALSELSQYEKAQKAAEDASRYGELYAAGSGGQKQILQDAYGTGITGGGGALDIGLISSDPTARTALAGTYEQQKALEDTYGKKIASFDKKQQERQGVVGEYEAAAKRAVFGEGGTDGLYNKFMREAAEAEYDTDPSYAKYAALSDLLGYDKTVMPKGPKPVQVRNEVFSGPTDAPPVLARYESKVGPTGAWSYITPPPVTAPNIPKASQQQAAQQATQRAVLKQMAQNPKQAKQSYGKISSGPYSYR